MIKESGVTAVFPILSFLLCNLIAASFFLNDVILR